MLTDALLDDARGIAERIIALRRAIHAEPELGLETPRTLAKVRDELADLPLEWRQGPSCTGAVAVLNAGKAGRSVLLRGDKPPGRHHGFDVRRDVEAVERAHNAGGSRDQRPYRSHVEPEGGLDQRVVQVQQVAELEEHDVGQDRPGHRPGHVEQPGEQAETAKGRPVLLVDMLGAVADDDPPGLEPGERDQGLRGAEDQREVAEGLEPERARENGDIDEAEQPAHAPSPEQPGGVRDDPRERGLLAEAGARGNHLA